MNHCENCLVVGYRQEHSHAYNVLQLFSWINCILDVSNFELGSKQIFSLRCLSKKVQIFSFVFVIKIFLNEKEYAVLAQYSPSMFGLTTFANICHMAAILHMHTFWWIYFWWSHWDLELVQMNLSEVSDTIHLSPVLPCLSRKDIFIWKKPHLAIFVLKTAAGNRRPLIWIFFSMGILSNNFKHEIWSGTFLMWWPYRLKLTWLNYHEGGGLQESWMSTKSRAALWAKRVTCREKQKRK